MSAGPVRISVIIPALNEEEMIGQCLEHLAGCDFPRDAFEVVVVDNGSTDRTIAVTESWSDRLHVTALSRPGINISALRNAGANQAKGHILGFLDADCLVPATWLQSAAAELSSGTPEIIGGSIAIPADSRWPARAWYGVGYAPKDGEVTYMPSGNMLLRRDDFFRIGGFDENLKTSEDWDLSARARAAGMRIRAVATMAVVHLRTPQTLADFYRRERWHGAHVTKMFLKNPKTLSAARTLLFGLYVLTCTLGLLAGLAIGLFAHRYTLLTIAGASLLCGALACSLLKLKSVRGMAFWQYLLPLTALHIAYGMARGLALLSVSYSYPRQAKAASSTVATV